ncbi:Glycosyltransferase involved in cell wall bisynthesis [Maribacter aquivivus]|uniref:Glycosyltransferase involved in cell wall bisynthesis n=1 Tax=Maribacter aquivivus TaxID=228958 RepID=A0A1M6LIB3_9FLAO|nr:glycosyltransferase family 4 protein [Maribacter aquivivus]SHJ70933.1 Glycosyltransferase involved in cell wall bisynthesis [Maribacter aquivivus]
MIIKPKVLFILHFPPPVNGAAMVGQYIKDSELINRTFEADFVNLTASFSLKSIGKGGLGKMITILKILKNVFFNLKRKDYDLCYMTLTAKGVGFYKDFLIVVLLKMFRKKIVFHFHNKGVLKSSSNKLNNLLYNFTFKNTDSIVLSPSLSYDIEKYVDKDRIKVCPNGIPEILEDSASNMANVDNNDTCRFLFLSNMMEEKGVLVLLKALDQLKDKKVNFECHFIGAWSDISDIKFNTVVKEYELTNYVFAHGKKYGDEKAQYFLNSDVFVFPTFYHNECFPLVLLEAMQYSLPIISTPEGGIVDLVRNGKTGILVKQKSIEELTNQLQLMSENKILRENLGKAARMRYEELYTLSEFEKNFSAILNNIVANN